MCPHCEQPLFGSASRGRLGKYYPAYHCNKRGHYFRVRKEDFEQTIADFVRKVAFNPDEIGTLTAAIEAEWNKRQSTVVEEELRFETHINGLRAQAKAMVDKMMLVSSEAAVKHMEEGLVKLEEEIKTLEEERNRRSVEKPTDMKVVLRYLKYFLEHLEDLLIKQIDPLKKANFFGLLFDKAPTYEEILSGTQNIASVTGLNELFKLKNTDKGLMVPPVGFEPTTSTLEPSCSDPLSYGSLTGVIIADYKHCINRVAFSAQITTNKTA